jgi:hypothetical protein
LIGVITKSFALAKEKAKGSDLDIGQVKWEIEKNILPAPEEKSL